MPAADGRFPVLVFSPGAGNLTLYYSSLLYEIASRGFVIAALWHPYTTEVVAFPDGTVLRSNAAGGMNGIPPGEQQARLERLGAVWATDQRFALDQAATWNAQHSVLRGHLDLQRVGTFGHSLGGAAAAQVAHVDRRFDAAVNMDGAMFGTVTTEGSRVPFLLIDAERPVLTDGELKQVGMTREQVDAWIASLGNVQATTIARSLELDTLIGTWDGADTLTLQADFAWRRGVSAISSSNDPATQPVPVRLTRQGTTRTPGSQASEARACAVLTVPAVPATSSGT